MFRPLVLLFITLLTVQAFPQKYINLKTYNVDSLLFILPGQAGEERVNSLNSLAVSLSFVDSDSSMQYADEAKKLAMELDYPEGIANAYRNYGFIYLYQGNYPMALDNFLEALSLFKQIGDKNAAGWVCYNIGQTHYFANNNEKTIEYGLAALDLFRERNNDGSLVGDVRDTIMMYAGLAETYAYLDMHEKSLELNLEVVDVMTENNFSTAELVINVFTTGVSFLQMGEADSAKAYFHRSIAYPDKDLSSKALKYRSFTYLGNFLFEEGAIDSSFYYFQTTYDFYYSNGFLYWALAASNNLGMMYSKNNDPDMAEKQYRQSEKIFEEMLARNSWYRHDSLKNIAVYGLELYFPLPQVRLNEFMWGQAIFMYHALYMINNSRERTREAFNYFRLYASAKDTLNELQQKRETIELQTRYETERKEKQIDYLSQENALQEMRLTQSGYLLVALGSLVLLITILAVFILRQNKLREQQKNLLLQQRLFRSQMNPHFLFNSLASIHNFMTSENPQKAGAYLTRFSKLVRSILNSSVEEYISLEDEIEMIENYLELQKVRFPDKFDFFITLDEALIPADVHVPSMLTQPFIENAIEHGIKLKPTKGFIRLRFKKAKEMLIIEIEDDGIGREKAGELQPNKRSGHKSLSTSIIEDRIRVLNKTLKNKITLEILDLTDAGDEPSGTLVRIEMPVN